MKRGEVAFDGDLPVYIPHCRVDEESFAPASDSPFPLPNGTQADPRQAWVLPSNEQEK